MAFKKPNRVRMSITGTPGTGDVSLNVATSGYQTLANGGVSNGDTFPYVIEDGANWEVGVGTYTSSGPSFARTTVRASSGGGTSKISATSSAIVYSAILGEDVGSSSIAGATDATITSPANGDVLTYVTADSKWENKPATGGGGVTYTPPDPTTLTAVTHLGGSTHNYATTGQVPALSVTSGASDNDSEMYCMMQAVPVGNWSAIAKVKVLSSGGTSGWKSAGLGVLNQSGNKGANIMRADGNNAYVCTFTSGTGFTGGSPITSITPTTPDQFLHIDYDGTNLTFSFSWDGVNKITINQTSAASMIGGAPTHVGVTWGSSSSSGAPVFDYFHYHVGASGTTGL